MKHFKPKEFQGYYKSLSPKLKTFIDRLRVKWGFEIAISPASGAVGRHLGPLSQSQHNVDKWKEVRALDIMPKRKDGKKLTRKDYEKLVGLAKQIGFTGIGVYPKWKPRGGLHVDVRVDRVKGKPALWGALPRKNGKQAYTSIERALDEV